MKWGITVRLKNEEEYVFKCVQACLKISCDLEGCSWGWGSGVRGQGMEWVVGQSWAVEVAVDGRGSEGQRWQSGESMKERESKGW